MDLREKIKKIAKRAIYADFKSIHQIFYGRSKNISEIMGIELCKMVNACESKEMSCRVRPEDPLAIPNLKYGNGQKLSIVLQGPIRLKDHFTLVTVRYYREMYPNATVIVSTWEDENVDELGLIQKAGAIIVKTKRPSDGGQRNVNFQMISTHVGVEKAAEMGAEYICKTRTDQRINRPHVLEFAINMIERYQPFGDYKQEGRLGLLSMNYGNMFYPYFMSDFLYIGKAHDIQALFDGELDERAKFELPAGTTRREYARKMQAPEVIILRRYLDNIGHICDFTVRDYWDAVRNCLICFDMRLLDLVWPKYEHHFSEHNYYGEFFYDDSPDKMKTVNFDFVNWFNLYSGTLEYKPEYEKYADMPF